MWDHQLGESLFMDTQGPAIRTGDLPVPLDLQPGQKFTLTVRGERSEEEHSVDVNYENFVNDINLGDVVLIDNGEIHMKVLAKDANKVECQVLTPGTLGSRRHINLPGVKVSLPPITEKDRADIALGLEIGVDYFALSFVRAAEDIRELRALLDTSRHKPLIIAKIEDQQAVKNIESIVQEADGIMVARGDLGIEVPYEELPIIQRRIVKTCLQHGRPVIVATHMLESMIDNPLPTRAEVTDVANAVFEQADAIMLSGETTVGKYPLKCVEVFDRIACRIERSGGANYHEDARLTSPRQKLIRSAVVMADQLRADGIVVFTVRGHMARHTSWLRPKYSPIFAMCDRTEVADELALYRGVIPHIIPYNYDDPKETADRSIKQLLARGYLTKGNTIVLITSMDAGDRLVDAVQMRHID
jgi:pyruvate kinase